MGGNAQFGLTTKVILVRLNNRTYNNRTYTDLHTMTMNTKSIYACRWLPVAFLLVAYSVLARAESGCKPQDATGYFQGTATTGQAGKLDVSLNLYCDGGRYAGELDTRSAPTQ